MSRMRTNQLRLWFAAMAYVLICALQRIGLVGTAFANATCGTIRLEFSRSALVRFFRSSHQACHDFRLAIADDWSRSARRLAEAANARATPV